jgi:hypothetical protein
MATSLATNHASEAAIVFIELATTSNNRRMKTRSGQENRKLQHTERAEARFRSRNPGTSQTSQCGRNRETRAANPRVLNKENTIKRRKSRLSCRGGSIALEPLS